MDAAGITNGLPGRHELLRAHAGLTVMVLGWGAFFPMLEWLLQSWDMFTATAARQLCAAVVLFLMLWAYERRFPLRRDLPWRAMLILGIVGFTGSSFLTTVAIYLSSGISAAIISATNPISAALTARLLYGVPLLRSFLVGAVIAAFGGILSAWGAGEFGRFGLGELLIVFTNMLWTWYSLAVQHWLRGFTQLHITALTIMPGAVAMVALTLVVGAMGWTELRADISPLSMLVMLYAGVISLAVGNLLWHFGVNRVGVNIASMYNNLIPLAAVLTSAAMGRLPTVWQVLGGVIIVASVFYAQLMALRSARRTQATIGRPGAV